MPATPVQGLIDLAHRVVDDVEAIGTTLSSHVGSVGAEGTQLTADTARLALESVQFAKDKLVEIERALIAAVSGK